MIEDHWNNQEKILREIYSKGVKQYIETLNNISEAFHLNNKNIGCIDEGIGKQCGIRIAGSCVFCSDKEALKIINDSDATGITSHAGCGAVMIDAINKGINPSKADEHAIQWAKHLAKISGIPYIGHIEKEQLNRPKDSHNARVAYYVNTETFNPSAVKGLPDGFVISRKYMNAEQAINNAYLSASIATGHHGYGSKINQESPFVFIIVANPNDPEATKQKLKAELKPIEEEYGGRVIIDGFTAPM